LKARVSAEDILEGFVEGSAGEVEDVTTESRGHSFSEVADLSPDGGLVRLHNAFVELWSRTKFDYHRCSVVRVEFKPNTIKVIEGNDRSEKRPHVEYLPKDGSFFVGEFRNEVSAALRLGLPETNVQSQEGNVTETVSEGLELVYFSGVGREFFFCLFIAECTRSW